MRIRSFLYPRKRMHVFTDTVDLEQTLRETRERGYAFVASAFHPDWLAQLQSEIDGLELEVGDHNAFPIQAGTKREVRQKHGRRYHMIDEPDAPSVAVALCYALAHVVDQLAIPELTDWLLTEIGYQRYSSQDDHISPHIDRVSDHLLSVTVTISGSTWVHMYRQNGDEVDYRNLERVDSFLTKPGTVMFLRAPGFGSGKQEIHEVMPPLDGVPRDILNLRMRRLDRLLPQPGVELVKG